MKQLLLLVLIPVSIGFAQDYRYTETQFEASTKTENIVYGTAPFLNFPYNNESNTTEANLVMDLYQPEGDDLTQRPAIVFAHSGGFLNGNRNHDDMVAFCDSLARKGYVTATIDYRKSFYVLEDVTLHGVRAVYRGIQDGRSAIRYLRANAKTYGIDPTKVYMAGSSAGSFIALHAAYMNEPEERPIETQFSEYTDIIFPFFHDAPDMGPVDVGLHLEQNGQPDAIIGLWGALQNTALITIQDSTPALLVHGTGDETVPFLMDHPFGFNQFPQVEGSGLIAPALDALNIENETYFEPDAPHEFHGTNNGNWPENPNEFWDIILDRSYSFLWKQHKPIANFTAVNETSLTLDFEDESQGAVSWLWNFGDGNTSTEQNPSHQYAEEGDYEITLYIENNIRSWDQITQVVNVQEILTISENNNENIALYPNPANDLVHIKGIENASITILNTIGQVILKANNTTQIDISNIPNGIYLVRIETEKDRYFKRVIKN